MNFLSDFIQFLKWLLIMGTLIFIGGMLSGCAGALGNITADNPIERGLSYIAVAIVTHE